MNLKETIKKILKEENDVNHRIKSLLKKHYIVDYDFGETRDGKFYFLDVKIRPKQTEDKEIFGIYSYYSIWTKKGKFEEENSAYLDGGFFKEIGLERPFINHIRSSVKEKVKNLIQ